MKAKKVILMATGLILVICFSFLFYKKEAFAQKATPSKKLTVANYLKKLDVDIKNIEHLKDQADHDSGSLGVFTDAKETSDAKKDIRDIVKVLNSFPKDSITYCPAMNNYYQMVVTDATLIATRNQFFRLPVTDANGETL